MERVRMGHDGSGGGEMVAQTTASTVYEKIGMKKVLAGYKHVAG